MGKYTEKDASEETDAGGKETSRAWHQAREDAQQSDHPVDQRLTEGWTREPDEPSESESDSDSSDDDTSSDDSA